MRNIPFVSVIMPVYNCEDFLIEAIDSILQQSFTDFELIIINDGSTDNTVGIIQGKLSDNRIVFLSFQENRGNYACRNEGCKIARGKYICVMDGDDVAMLKRFEKQVEIMENNSDILALGTDFEFLGQGVYYKPKEYPLNKILLLQNNMFLHPSLIIRKDILKSVGYYDEQFYYASDYDLVCKIALKGKIINIPDVLMRYRLHEKQISSFQYLEQNKYANEIRIKYLKSLGFSLSSEDETVFTKIMSRDDFSKQSSELVIRVCTVLKEQNDQLKCFDKNIFCCFLSSIQKAYGLS